MQQLIKICMELEKEQKINKDLSLNIVKLNKIIQTGQDALSEEQDLVKNLQETLHSHSQVSEYTFFFFLNWISILQYLMQKNYLNL